MDKAQLLKTLKLVKENSTKRNFKQTIDLIINFKDIDLKKQDNKIDIYTQLHFTRGRKVKICGLVGPELLEQARKHFDTAISADDFGKYKEKKVLKKIAREHAFFVAQANIMPQVATVFGRILGPLGKMPSPKAGCVVPPNANLQPLAEKLQKTVRIKVDTNPIYQCYAGREDMEEEQVIDNIMTIYNSVVHALPNDIHNIRSVCLKLTMGRLYKVGAEEKEDKAGKKPAKKPEAAKEEKSKETAKKTSKEEPAKEEKPAAKEKPKEEKYD